MSSNWLAIRELPLNAVVGAGLAELCVAEAGWTTEMGFGVRRPVAIR